MNVSICIKITEWIGKERKRKSKENEKKEGAIEMPEKNSGTVI